MKKSDEKPKRKSPAKKRGPAMARDSAVAAAAKLRRRAEASIPKPMRKRSAAIDSPTAVVDDQRLLHELQVHQIELEMQNAELQEARDRAEGLLDKFADLYDFAPVGYFSLDEKGRILEVNLTGAALLGVVRSRLINRLLPRFAEPPFRSGLQDLLAQVFTENGNLLSSSRWSCGQQAWMTWG